jgi:FtsP/CotA-like multicopper oxidase with cupredoxin domain
VSKIESRPPEGEKCADETQDLSRRRVLQLGVTAGAAATVLTSRKSWSQEDYPDDPPIPPAPTVCSPRPTNSPATRPFVQAMPIPAPAIPRLSLNPSPTRQANIAQGEAPRPDHQGWDEFRARVYYDVRARPALHRFHPDLQPSYVWGFDGRVPGPTFLARYDVPMLVRFRNQLPENHTGFGINELTVHLHNGHTPYESDGFAQDYYGPGLFKDLHYPNCLAGYEAYPPKGDHREAMHTLWYHDHRHSFTSPNTYRGLTGMYFLYDDRDSGNEFDFGRNALRLPAPYGLHDIPLILSDKLFCPDGQLFSADAGGVPVGDKFVVNGAIQPYFQVRRRKYRFRVLNSGPTRTWTLALSDGTPFKVIATDGNLLQSPIDVPTLRINVAERYDFVLDFSTVPAGTKIYLSNDQPQFVGNAGEPVPLPPGVVLENVVLRFDVIGDPLYPDPSRVPAVLCEYPPLNLDEVVGTRTWDFDLVNGQFLINGQVFDPDVSLADVRKGTAERWILRNKLPLARWSHPVHIHFEEFRVLSRNGAAPPPLETGRKDVVVLPGNNEVELFMRFRDFTGKYMIHCHNMNHEDNFMLVRWDITKDAPLTASATFTPAKGARA